MVSPPRALSKQEIRRWPEESKAAVREGPELADDASGKASEDQLWSKGTAVPCQGGPVRPLPPAVLHLPHVSLQPLLQPEERKPGKMRKAHPHVGQALKGGGRPPREEGSPRTPSPSICLSHSFSLPGLRAQGVRTTGPQGLAGRSSGV